MSGKQRNSMGSTQASQAISESVCGGSFQMIDYKKLAGTLTAIKSESELLAHRRN